MLSLFGSECCCFPLSSSAALARFNQSESAKCVGIKSVITFKELIKIEKWLKVVFNIRVWYFIINFGSVAKDLANRWTDLISFAIKLF